MIQLPCWRILLLLFGALYLVNAHAIQCHYSLTNEWNSGFTSSIAVTNDTTTTINGWEVVIEFPDGTQITGAWNAILSGNNPYRASNQNYNASIQPNASQTFGFNSQKTQTGTMAMPPILGGICDNIDNDAPTAHATASSLTGIAPFSVSFDASHSEDPENNALFFHWDFGDGTTSSEQSPTKTFAQAGDYSISLIVSDGELESQPVQFAVVVDPPSPETALCEYSIVNQWQSGFTAGVRITNVEDVPIRGWNVHLEYPDGSWITGTWNGILSGDNPYQIHNADYNQTIAPEASVTFGFNAQRPYQNAPLIVPSLGGICSQANNHVRPTAVATASISVGDAPLNVLFDGSGSSDDDGDTLSYLWNFADGNISNEVSPTHLFTDAGTYRVSLTVSDGTLESEPAVLTIVVDEPEPISTYQLDVTGSSLYFVSTKKVHVIETHTFTEMTGSIAQDGTATLLIDLDSVESGIVIRNQRMRDHLFETATYAQAEVTLAVDLNQIKALSQGSSFETTIEPRVQLHGFNLPLATQVRVTKLTATAVLVQNVTPILVNAVDFGLDAGIETLRSLAGLDVISYAVPVNFTLLFSTQPQVGEG